MNARSTLETARYVPAEKIPVGVLGATGSVGQRFVSLLAGHPWFELVAVAASARSAGKPYREAVKWALADPLPAAAANLTVLPTEPGLPCRLLFSALDAEVAGEVEERLARAGHFVVSNAKNHRMDPDVPLVVPEVNPEHLALVQHQRFGEGAIVTNPNCCTIPLTIVLKPLADAFGLDEVAIVTMQAVSGAGLPGVPSMLILDNVIPFISGEEEKVESETRKILGRLEGTGVTMAPIVVSAQCNRVAVLDGHTECISLRFSERVRPEDVRAVLASFRGEPQRLGLPSAPARPVELVDENDRPQARLDRDRGRGMAVAVGRVRPCPLFGIKLVALSHNTVRGAAGGALLVAELAVAQGVIPATEPALAAS
jgi:aspartate-semialdehyde dehydrogenase